MSQITEQDIIAAQDAWGDGIVKIGKVYQKDKEDFEAYKATAEAHIKQFYNYGGPGGVLFKPTLASEIQFRPTFEGALSYFVNSNPNFPEDHGFAIKPWTKVRWERHGSNIIGDMAVAMGNYLFTTLVEGKEEAEVKVEYTFGYTKVNGELKIILHGSHLPYSPE